MFRNLFGSRDRSLIPESKRVEQKKVIVPETMVKQRHAAILRECLAWASRRTPPTVQKKILTDLARYAQEVREYCECPQRVFIDREKKYACLDCGQRHGVATGKIEVVK